MSRQETKKGFCVNSSYVNVAGGEGQSGVRHQRRPLFGVRSYVSRRSKQKQESPAAASWISLVSPHMLSVKAEV